MVVLPAQRTLTVLLTLVSMALAKPVMKILEVYVVISLVRVIVIVLLNLVLIISVLLAIMLLMDSIVEELHVV